MSEENQNHYDEFWGKIAGYGRFQIITEPKYVKKIIEAGNFKEDKPDRIIPGEGIFLSQFTKRPCICAYDFKGGETICLDGPHESVHPPTIKKTKLTLDIYVDLEDRILSRYSCCKANLMILKAVKKFPYPLTDGKDDCTYKGLFFLGDDEDWSDMNALEKVSNDLEEFEKNPEKFKHQTFEIWKKIYFE